jgi:hypothetical protein
MRTDEDGGQKMGHGTWGLALYANFGFQITHAHYCEVRLDHPRHAAPGKQW